VAEAIPARLPNQDLTPASALPLTYFVFAHAALLSATATLVVEPSLPGGWFYHPRMVALVHVVTLGWISASILGAFYIVAPLALRLPMPVGRGDWIASAVFALGAAGMVAHLWRGDYDAMAVDGGLATSAILWVGMRFVAGLRRAVAPWPVLMHVALAFANIIVAAVAGILIGLDRSRGWFDLPPMAAAFAHAHLAAIGWAAMMVVGLSYRLIPMILPAAMPSGWTMAVSGVLLEAGLAIVLGALLTDWGGLSFGAALIVTGFVSFAAHMRRTVQRRLPRPPALPARDWSTWQAHGALLWLPVAAVCGLVVAFDGAGSETPAVQWLYGVAGLLGFLAQIVVGMQGRLVPLYAWYRAFAARGGRPPVRAANELPTPAFARPVFLLWAAGVPALAWGLAFGHETGVRLGALAIAAGVVVGFLYLRHLMRAARAEPDERAR
jgi:hypothetical protein